MKLNDLFVHKGHPSQPVVVLIHGFGMNGGFWEQPESCFVLGGLATLALFLADQPPAKGKKTFAFGRMAQARRGLLPKLVDKGFSVVSWSQRQPLGPIRFADEELAQVMEVIAEELPARPVWLLCHSRGGLVARLYLARPGRQEVAGCITLGTPHGGTELASLHRYLQPVGGALQKLFKPRNREGKLFGVMQRVADFLGSEAIAELKPASSLLRSLPQTAPGDIAFYSFGGTNPELFSLYFNSGDDWRPLPFPDFLLRVIPERKIPAELLAGRGDGLVSAVSARLTGAEHADFAVNHVRLAYEPAVGREVLRILGG